MGLSTITGNLLTDSGISSANVPDSAFPSQTGNSGKFLTTNGSALSWAAGGSGMTLLDTSTYSLPGTSTWTKPASAKFISVIVVGGGGGGASGAAAVGSGVAGGTGGGGGGGVLMLTIPATAFNTTESVVVGAGGIGGAANSRTGAGANATTPGNNGNNGGDSSFGELVAKGGNGGAYTAANNALGMGGAPIGFPSFTTDSALAGYTVDGWTAPIAISGPGGCGAATDKNPTAVAALTMSTFVPTGGGFGGTPGTSTATENGGAGGQSVTAFGTIAGGTAGTAGVAGGNGNLAAFWFGTGGGGGFGAYLISGTVTATAGGNGSVGAGGGGGGSARCASTASPNQANGGAGGNGGDGYVVIYTFG